MRAGKIKKAVVLLSGGLDSATCLYWARSQGYTVEALGVDYGQRHACEIRSARALARAAGARFTLQRVRLPWLKASSLVDAGRPLPNIPLAKIGRGGIPSTYVPGRNTIFVALGLSLADTVDADAVVVGANILDYSGYPDCRPSFYRAFARVARMGTRRGSEGKPLQIKTPLIKKDKAGIVRMAVCLGVPLEKTWSCYRGGATPCGRCDSCKLRAKGFAQAGINDPAL